MNCRDVVGRRCPASLSSWVSKPPLLCLLVVVNCRLPSARVTETPDGRSCGGLSSESKVAGNVEDGDAEENAHWPLGRFVTKSDTLSRLSLTKAVWRVGRILGDELAQVQGTGTPRPGGGSMGPRSSVLANRDLTSHHAPHAKPGAGMDKQSAGSTKKIN